MLNKPKMEDIRKKLQSVGQEQAMEYLSMAEKREELYFESDEVKEMANVLKRLTSELHDQVTENLCEREQLKEMFDKYDTLYSTYQSLLDYNRQLKA